MSKQILVPEKLVNKNQEEHDTNLVTRIEQNTGNKKKTILVEELIQVYSRNFIEKYSFMLTNR